MSRRGSSSGGSTAGARRRSGGTRAPIGLVLALAIAFGLAADRARAQQQGNAVRDAAQGIGGVLTDAFRSFGDDLGQIFAGSTRRTVDFEAVYPPGTIVVRTNERKLYYVVARGKALRYSVGVGREGFQWGGSARISRKAEWPSWRPPDEMLERRPDLPRFMPGGPDNPLGARALYIGDTLYRIHGTAEKHTIGGAVSSGCIRMLNKDVIDLYERVNVGAQVHVFH